MFLQVLRNVQREYAKFGQLFRFIQNGRDMLTNEQFDGSIQIDFSFRNRSDGWIGLAIVGRGDTCSGRIWCRYLSTYRPSNVVREWTTLVLHELGHNCGRGHTRGGVMNPSIVQGLGAWNENDPSYQWLKGQFGGVPFDLGGDSPPPPKNAAKQHRGPGD